MITKTVLATAVALTLIATASASALSLTNEDKVTYEVSLILGQGDASAEVFQLGASEQITDLCEEGCMIRLNDSAWINFEGAEVLKIQDGKIVAAE